MALTEEGTGTTMLVQPSGFGGNGGFGDMGSGWWILLLFILMGGWGGNYEYSGRYYGPISRERRNSYGYSRTGNMVDHLRAVMDEAPDENTRMEIKKLMDRMSN